MAVGSYSRNLFTRARSPAFALETNCILGIYGHEFSSLGVLQRYSICRLSIQIKVKPYYVYFDDKTYQIRFALLIVIF